MEELCYACNRCNWAKILEVGYLGECSWMFDNKYYDSSSSVFWFSWWNWYYFASQQYFTVYSDMLIKLVQVLKELQNEQEW